MSKPKDPELVKIDVYVGKRLRRKRRILGMTQADLAPQVDIKFQQIQKYECGANSLTAGRIVYLCKALKVDANYFFEGLIGEESSVKEIETNLSNTEVNKLIALYSAVTPKRRALARKLLAELSNLGPDKDEG